MKPWARTCLAGAGLSLACCAASGDPAVPSATGGEGAAADSDERARPETDFTRKRDRARLKREQCLALGSAIQQAQQQDIILNVNDSGAMLRIASELGARARQIGAEAADLDGLGKLRDEYARSLDGMAEALTAAASAKGERDRKPSIKRFHEHEARTGTLLEELSDFCNAPID